MWNTIPNLALLIFLPKADDAHIYEAAPYEEISNAKYGELTKKATKVIDWDKIIELDDNTTGSQELACTGDACEI